MTWRNGVVLRMKRGSGESEKGFEPPVEKKGYTQKFVNAEGRAYAPWMWNQMDVDATARAHAARAERKHEETLAKVRDGTAKYDGAQAELGGGPVRLSARTVLPGELLDAKPHGAVELKWTAPQQVTVEKHHHKRKEASEGPFKWEKLQSGATSPFLDEDAELGETTYRLKSGETGEVLSQVAVFVESVEQRRATVVETALLGFALAVALAVGMKLDSIPKV